MPSTLLSTLHTLEPVDEEGTSQALALPGGELGLSRQLRGWAIVLKGSRRCLRSRVPPTGWGGRGTGCLPMPTCGLPSAQDLRITWPLALRATKGALECTGAIKRRPQGLRLDACPGGQGCQRIKGAGYPETLADRPTDGKALNPWGHNLGLSDPLSLPLHPLLPASSQPLSLTWPVCLSQPIGHLWGSGKELGR